MENTINLSEIKEAVFTQADLNELARLENRPVTFDNDCPEVTPEQAIHFRRVNPIRQAFDY